MSLAKFVFFLTAAMGPEGPLGPGAVHWLHPPLCVGKEQRTGWNLLHWVKSDRRPECSLPSNIKRFMRSSL